MTANDVLKIAKAELGTKENPMNSNKVKYNTWYYGRAVSGSDYPWCMVFVQWVFNQSGSPLPHRTASCGSLMDYAKKQKRWVTKGYKPGDVVIFQFTTGRHTGIVESATTSTVTCIEGNTTSGSSGDQANGGGVYRRTRNISCVLGAYRPDYSEAVKTVSVTVPQLEKGCDGASVEALQILLNGLNYNCGKVDGYFGSNTEKAVKAFQKAHKLTADGIVGVKSWAALLT